jgi:hypothetical protein
MLLPAFFFLGALPPCATQFSFNALFLAFCGPAELLPLVVKQSSAFSAKSFVKPATKTDVALREALAPEILWHRKFDILSSECKERCKQDQIKV